MPYSLAGYHGTAGPGLMRAACLFLPIMGCSILVEQDLYLAWQYTRADPNVCGTDDVTMGEQAPHVGSVGKGEMSFPILSITICGRKESWLWGCKDESCICPSTAAVLRRAFPEDHLGSTVGLAMDVGVVCELALKM